MAYDEYLADRIAQVLKEKQVLFEEKPMMGGVCFMVDAKMCVCVTHENLMARIGPEMYAEALEKEGCHEMNFTGKPMKGFVYVDPDGIDRDEDLEYWIQLALDYNPKAKRTKKKKMNKKGFTLVELLVVIAIIGILSTIAVTNLSAFKEKAQIVKVQHDMNAILKVIEAARLENDTILQGVTGSWWTSENCEDIDVRNIIGSSPCITAWANALDNLAIASGMRVSNLLRDPWGSPYFLDENQYDPGWSNDCSAKDTLRSAGPDGIISSSGGQTEDADNINLFIPLFDKCP